MHVDPLHHGEQDTPSEPARVILRAIERYARGDPTALPRDIIAELDRAGFVIMPRPPRQPDRVGTS
jgi:hypothetical protein